MFKKIVIGLISAIGLLLLSVSIWGKLYNYNKVEKVFICLGKVVETGQTEKRSFTYTTTFGTIKYVDANGDYYFNPDDDIYFSDNLLGIMKNYGHSIRAIKFNRVFGELEMITRPIEGKSEFIETFVGNCELTVRK